MEPHWEQADCALDAATVAVMLELQAPELRLSRPRFLDEGWSSWAYVAIDPAGRDWILRFPKRAFVALELQRELTVLPRLEAALPLAIPRFELIGRPSDLYPHPFVGYPKLEGTPGIDCLDAAFDVQGTGAALGAFVAALHGIALHGPLPFADELREAASDRSDRPTAEETAREQLERFGGSLSRTAKEAALATLACEPRSTASNVLLHADLFAEHVLLSAGDPVAVIDWGGLSHGDPAEDLSGLYYWRGAAMLAAGLAAYAAAGMADRAELERIEARVRYNCVRRAGDDLEYGTRARRPEYYRVAKDFLERLAEEGAP